ncbi:MAG TPA: helix-turn-helix domain containing protein [Epulopiscium sp.]|nr:helix-turn-helix domain containing protein [Candidatus Epulonipiscium sp.]
MQKDFRFKIISEGLKNGVSITCRKYNISRTLYYRWLKRYKAKGIDGLVDVKKDFIPLNKTDSKTEEALLNLIKEYPHYGPKALNYLFDELGYNISESAVYNIMKRNNLTKKVERINYAKKQVPTTPAVPALDKLSSGECWIFWTTEYGYYENLGNIYEYTLYDLKSRIACTRLYKEIALKNFEDLLTAVAMPIANALHLEINFLYFFENDKISKQLGRTFNSKINTLIIDNAFDFKIHTLLSDNEDFGAIDTLRNNYTEGCLSFLIKLNQTELTFGDLKLKFQDYLRDYNLSNKSIFDGEAYSPVDYHNKLTNTKLILPLWAYINRKY